jgi:glycine cleavage system H lipoate-binding protein
VDKEKKILVSIEIDKLTNSIENVVSGDVFDTDVIQLFSKDTRQINKPDWQFNWHGQLKLADREVYKLVIKDNVKIIQGVSS